MKTITLGILGGGQLGRMSAMAAARLGVRTAIYTDEPESPAGQVSAHTTVGSYEDRDTLQRFAEIVDVISYEFENIPVETVQYLKTLKPVYPDETLLRVSQDRVAEKTYLNNVGIETARWQSIAAPADVLETLKRWNTDRCILKTIRFGYDGKGQKIYRAAEDINDTFRMFNHMPLIAEEVIDFDSELSVIVARDDNGKMAVYGPMRNEHNNHILSQTIVPADISPSVAQQAIGMAETLAKALDLRGVLTLELFVTKDGRLLANEIAPRTHNSGHWTIDACAVSQFENHVRAVCGLPVGDPGRHSDCIMTNLIGDDILTAGKYLEQPGACLHLYGKRESKPGRKMGHVTVLKPML